jgi:hypothetical protein
LPVDAALPAVLSGADIESSAPGKTSEIACSTASCACKLRQSPAGIIRGNRLDNTAATQATGGLITGSSVRTGRPQEIL